MTNSQLDTTKESQEVSPFPAGDHKALINRRAQRHSKHKTEKNIKDPQKKYRLGTVSKNHFHCLITVNQFDLNCFPAMIPPTELDIICVSSTAKYMVWSVNIFKHHPHPQVVSAVVCSKTVVLLLLIHCLLVCKHLAKERAECFYVVVFSLSCGCLFSVSSLRCHG